VKTTIYVLLFSAFLFGQNTYFIKYKETVSRDEIESKVQSNQFLPEGALFRLSNINYTVDHFAKGIARDYEELSRIIKVRFDEAVSADIVNALSSIDPEIEYVQRSTTYKINIVPDDSLLSEQWALAKIKAFEAWDLTTGSDTVLLAIIDTGIEYFHPDLINKIYFNIGEIGLDQFGNDKRFNGIDDDNNGFVDDYMGWDFVDRVGFPLDTTAGDFLNWDNLPYDSIQGINGFHATYVAGIAGAEYNNQTGIAGVGPNIKLLNIRSFDNLGSGEEDDAAAAILYAVQMGAKVINMSWGDNSFSFVLRDVIRYAYSRGVVLVASAGNRGITDPHYPSGYTEVISVGNSTINDTRSGNSNYGSTLDLMAPGTNILSTTVGGDYRIAGGTSASAPHVSAAAALILSLNNFTNEEVKQILKSTCDDIGTPGWDMQTGAGRLNIFRALSVLAPAKIKFNHPLQDFGTSKDTIELNLTVMSPYFVNFSLHIGEGLNPITWTPLLTSITYQVANENLYNLNLNSLNDGSYTLRLVVTLVNGSSTEERVNFHLIRTAPKVEIVGEGPIYYGDRSTIMAEVYTSQRSIVRLFYRKLGTSEFNFISLDGFASNNQFVKQFHYGFIPKSLVHPSTFYEIYYEAENLSGLKTKVLDTLNNLSYFLFKTEEPPQPVITQQKDYTLPRGILFSEPVSFLSDNYNEILFQAFYPTQTPSYGLYQLNNNILIKMDSLTNKIPRQFGDFNNNGLKDLLCLTLPNVLIEEQAYNQSFTFNNKYSNSKIFDPKIIYDLTKDGNNELVTESPNKDSYILWRVNADLSIDSLHAFYKTYNDSIEPNYDLNNRTTANLIVADTDNDGRNEIWFIDHDGDLISYIVNPDGSFTKGDSLITVGWRVRNSNIMDIGDYDGDGKKDIAILYLTNSIAPNLLLLIINFDQNGYKIISQKVFLDQSNEYRNLLFGTSVYQTIKFVDLDNDGADELVVNVFPYVYILKHTSAGDKIIYFDEGVNTPRIFKGDLDQNGLTEIGLHYSDGYKFFEFASSNKASTPYYVEGFSVDTSTIKLTWKGDGELFYIYQGDAKNNLVKVDSSFINEIFIANLQKNKSYFFSIQAVQSFKPNPISSLSNVVEVYVHEPARVSSAVSNSSKSVLVTFSEKILTTIENLQSFEVIGFGTPNSVSPANQYAYLLSFNRDLPEGQNRLAIKNLRDLYFSPIKKDTVNFTVSHAIIVEEFFISSYLIISPYKIKVEFNLEVDMESAQNLDNYSFDPVNNIKNVIVDQNNPKVIYLELDGRKPVGAVGKEYRLRIENLISSISTGAVKINTGAGSYLVLAAFTETLADVYVYPNPAIASKGYLTFANLPKRANIFVFSLNGDQIAALEETDGNGGINFDLKDKYGNTIGSGVYIYRIVRLDDANNEVEEKLGKFSVIR
jgi:subtilisin family serine protease